MPKVAKSSVKVKEENEIQSYINSFKEIEETEEIPSTSGGSDKVFITPDQNYEQIESGGDGEYKYVFIVQDDEDGVEDKIIGEGEEEDDGENQVYEFEDYEEEEMFEEVDDKSKIVKIGAVSKKSTSTAQTSAAVHMCSYCIYSTSKRYLLARHMKCHSEDRPHKCNVCERGFKTIASLTNHVNTHTGIKVSSQIIYVLLTNDFFFNL